MTNTVLHNLFITIYVCIPNKNVRASINFVTFTPCKFSIDKNIVKVYNYN